MNTVNPVLLAAAALVDIRDAARDAMALKMVRRFGRHMTLGLRRLAEIRAALMDSTTTPDLRAASIGVDAKIAIVSVLASALDGARALVDDVYRDPETPGACVVRVVLSRKGTEHEADDKTIVRAALREALRTNPTFARFETVRAEWLAPGDDR